jgi:signal transduction histidine kinase
VNFIYTLVALPFVLMAAWMIAKRLLAPIRRIVAAAERISGGRLKERIAYDHPDDELGHVVATLNKAFDEYDENLERQKQFAANAAHQLRTPLTAMRSAGEICLAHARTPEQYRDAMASMLERIERLSRTCEQLLELSRMDSPALRARLTRCNPAEAIRKMAEEFAPVAKSRGIALHAAIANDITAEGIPDLLGELVGNLLDNAIRHAPENGVVNLFWRTTGGGTAELCVEDNGPGIPDAMRDGVLQPFHQGVHPHAGGAGLGLAIVSEIARVHSGTVRIARSELGGARISVTLPT